LTTGEGPHYGLPPAQLEEIFQQIILPDYLLRSGPVPQAHPEVVLLGGQPGAGKSTVAAQLQNEFAGRGGLVWVTWDDFRPFHPDYERLLAEQPAAMPDVTRPAARWWQDRAAAYLRTGHYNTLLEGGFRDPGNVLAAAESFDAAGYQVHVSALAVPAVLSRLGIIERYAGQVQAVGTGRWTTAASHDADYLGTVDVLRLAHTSPAVSRISLWTRNGLVHDDQRAAAGHWPTGLAAADVLTRLRNLPLSQPDRAALTGRLTSTMGYLDQAGLAHPGLREMAATIEQDLVRPPATAAAGPAEDISHRIPGRDPDPGVAARERDDPEPEL
jgi:hypothetical protein